MQTTFSVLRRAGLALACAAAFSAPAAAQQAEQSTEFQSYRIPGWSFTPSVAIGTTYDSNVRISSRSVEGETDSDSVFNIVPGGQLEYLGRRTDFNAGYRGYLRRYVEFDGLNGFDQRGTVGLKHLLNRRWTLHLRDSYADSPSTDETEVNGVPFSRIGSRTNTMRAGADVRLTKFSTLATRYESTWVAFDQAAEPLVLTGGWIHGVGSDFAHQMNERLSLGAEYGYRTASLDEGARELSFHNGGGVVSLAIAPHTKVAGALGFSTLHDRNTDVFRSGPYIRLGISHSLEVVSMGAGYERQYVPSFGFGGATANQELRGYITMPLGRQRMYVQGSGAWRRSNPFEATSLQLDTIWLRSTVGYMLTRWGRLEGLYTYTRQDSIDTGGEIDRHRVGVQFVVSQPMRIH